MMAAPAMTPMMSAPAASRRASTSWPVFRSCRLLLAMQGDRENDRRDKQRECDEGMAAPCAGSSDSNTSRSEAPSHRQDAIPDRGCWRNR